MYRREDAKFYSTEGGLNSSFGETNVVYNPLKGISPYGWHFEQEVYLPEGIVRAVKAGGGSGNIPKVILKECYYIVEDGKECCLDKFEEYEDAYEYFMSDENAKEIFLFDKNDNLLGCMASKKANATKNQFLCGNNETFKP